ncbi:hypothetical protein C8R47DRAFT_1284302 [Mycena vitilis]|nr:hypothetical protein C8R47DRAFT_1284302 [Mycena vitilis]
MWPTAVQARARYYGLCIVHPLSPLFPSSAPDVWPGPPVPQMWPIAVQARARYYGLCIVHPISPLSTSRTPSSGPHGSTGHWPHSTDRSDPPARPKPSGRLPVTPSSFIGSTSFPRTFLGLRPPCPGSGPVSVLFSDPDIGSAPPELLDNLLTAPGLVLSVPRVDRPPPCVFPSILSLPLELTSRSHVCHVWNCIVI